MMEDVSKMAVNISSSDNIFAGYFSITNSKYKCILLLLFFIYSFVLFFVFVFFSPTSTKPVSLKIVKIRVEGENQRLLD